MNHHDGRSGGHPWVGVLCMALLVGGLVALLVWALGRGRHGHPVHSAPVASPTANAEAILAERLARGEVTPEDYRLLLAALRGEPSPAAS